MVSTFEGRFSTYPGGRGGRERAARNERSSDRPRGAEPPAPEHVHDANLMIGGAPLFAPSRPPDRANIRLKPSITFLRGVLPRRPQRRHWYDGSKDRKVI